MSKPTIHVAVTGGAGQIAYSLLFRIANGDLLGKDQPIALHILELPEVLKVLEGVKMELDDCAFPLLKEIHIGSDPHKVFEGVQYALLVGSKPRGPGMERGELLRDNGKIFIGQGQALNDAADENVKVLVVGNPCNTNCLIAMRNAPRLNPRNFHAMTRLDQNRSTSLLATKSGADVTDVTNVTIWGNHSSTQVPDFYHARIHGQPVTQVIKDLPWLENEFMPIVQKRGAAIIAARGKSSAASAASAALDAMRSILIPTQKGDWFSSGVCSDGNPYGIEQNLIFSFPCRSNGDGTYEIVNDVAWNDQLRRKIELSEKELMEERQFIGEFLKIGVSNV